MEIILYTKPYSSSCDRVRKYLRDKQLPFKEINVYEDDIVYSMVKLWGIASVPFLEIDREVIIYDTTSEHLDEIIMQKNKDWEKG